VLGIDYGTKRVGLALGDPESGLVLALPVLEHPGEDEALVGRLAEIVRERDAAVVLLGDPLHASGEESAMSRRVAAVRAALQERLPDTPVELMDERRTSVEAEATLSAAGLRWWQYEKGRLDAMAAMAIVRDYLFQRDPGLGLHTAEPPPPPDPRKDRRARRRKAQRRQRRQRDPNAGE
jgi:putative Holliday junction resolvase